jgi:hypothetical protein
MCAELRGAGQVRKEGLLFVNKKKQKNFVNLGHGRWRRQRLWPNLTKIFAPLFLKAAAFFSLRIML